MDQMFVDIHPAFLRSLLSSIEVAPPDDMSVDDKAMYRTVSRLMVLLTDTTTDAHLVALWKQALAESHVGQ